MEQSSDEFDLDDWEFLPDNGFLDFYHYKEGGKVGFDQKGVLDMDYFICPSLNSPQIIEISKDSNLSGSTNRSVPVPVQWKSPVEKNPDDEFVKEITQIPVLEVSIIPPLISEKIKAPNFEAISVNQDTVSQIFFRKMENEFVDIKMESPRSENRGIKPSLEVGSEVCKEESKNTLMAEIDQDLKKETYLDSNKTEESKWVGEFNLWKLKFTGIGALCSIGMAAATICIFVFGSHQRNKHHKQNQKLRFQIYTGEKKIKQMVQHETTINQAISAVRGVPLARAHITFGGYYYGL